MSSISQVQNAAENFERALAGFQERSIEKCFASNSENVNGFVQCISKSVDKIEEVSKTANLVMVFVSAKAGQYEKEGKDEGFIESSTSKILEQKYNELSRLLE